jgi:hypothetical protein
MNYFIFAIGLLLIFLTVRLYSVVFPYQDPKIITIYAVWFGVVFILSQAFNAWDDDLLTLD